MPSLKEANALLRIGKYREAFAMFAELRAAQPEFAPYEHGYLLARRRLYGAWSEDSVISGKSLRHAEHPQSRPGGGAGSRTFMVVTPVLNGEHFIAQSLDSVFQQTGDFFIDYVVKDAGSTDNTPSILLEYLERIDNGSIPLHCLGIRFSVESSPDKGLYDGVAHGFELSRPRAAPSDILTYINADDVYEETAFATVARVMNTTRARWICGQINVINDRNECVVSPDFPLGYAREDIADGRHDGRNLYFIQQEGSFWLRDLYDKVGGLNRALRLAGDFDLWRRFAGETELLAMNVNLASFRSHAGQLSEQIDKYYAEVDAVMGDGRTARDLPLTASTQFFNGQSRPAGGADQRPGPVCFLDKNGEVLDIAYLKRAWFNW